jgi:perosamine synthetase
MLDLGIHGGTPTRKKFLPYAKQYVDQSDIEAVVEVLKSDYLTTGPKIEEFEQNFAWEVGAGKAVAVNSGTATLHLALLAIDIKPGDEVIVPDLTFVASASAVTYMGAFPVFADVDSDTLTINPDDVAKKITSKTRAIITVDYAGQPCQYDELMKIADKYNLVLIADACHSLGAEYKGQKVGAIADITCFSFHPVKHLTTGEGGMVVTDSVYYANRMRTFRNHGRKNNTDKTVREIGYNYRLNDIACALGISQLKRLDGNIWVRKNIAKYYDEQLESINGIRPIGKVPGAISSYHLYVVRVNKYRDEILVALRGENIGATIHYRTVTSQPAFAKYKKRASPVVHINKMTEAEKASNQIITLPLFPTMSYKDAGDVISAVKKVMKHFI